MWLNCLVVASLNRTPGPGSSTSGTDLSSGSGSLVGVGVGGVFLRRIMRSTSSQLVAYAVATSTPFPSGWTRVVDHLKLGWFAWRPPLHTFRDADARITFRVKRLPGEDDQQLRHIWLGAYELCIHLDTVSLLNLLLVSKNHRPSKRSMPVAPSSSASAAAIRYGGSVESPSPSVHHPRE